MRRIRERCPSRSLGRCCSLDFAHDEDAAFPGFKFELHVKSVFGLGLDRTDATPGRSRTGS